MVSFHGAKKNKIRKWGAEFIVLSAAFFGGLNALAQGSGSVLFEDDFEAGDLQQGPLPVWSWNQPYSVALSDGSHMMYGMGDIYEVADDVAHTGRYSLRLNFEGRNNFCNVCGTKQFEAKGVGTPAAHLVSKDGEILAAQSSSAAAGRVFYNRNDYFSRWKWGELRKSMVGQEGHPEIHAMKGKGDVQSGNIFLRPNQCGIDGSVGRNIDRRSDCDRAINYFKRVSDKHFPYGGMLSRRFYIYIPEETSLPENTFKLGYSFFQRSSDNGKEEKSGQAIVLSVQRDVQLEVKNQQSLGKTIFTGERLKRNTWYYIEEVWQRESSPLSNDGQYWLYFSEDGGSSEDPLVHRDGVRFGRLLSMSIHGNWQHVTDVKGYVYFDNIKIAQYRTGPVGSDKVSAKPARPGRLVGQQASK